MSTSNPSKRLLFVVNVDWFFLSHRLPIALEAMRRGYEVHIAVGLTDKREEIEAHGLTVHPLDLQRGSSDIRGQVRTFRQILAVYRQVKPDLVHLVTIKPVLLGGLAAHLSKPTGMVAAISGLGTVFVATGLKARLRRLLVGLLYRSALAHRNLTVIFQNPTDRTLLCGLSGLPERQTALIRGSGVDLTKYVVKPLPEGKPVVLLAARMLKDKGVLEFVEAARLLRGRAPELFEAARFVLVGEPDPENNATLTQAELDGFASEGTVELWGYRSDMADVLSQAHVVVLPSYREGLPKVLIEAAACGRAVITTDVPGCRDAIEPGVSGLLAPVRRAEELADALEQLLRDPERVRALGAAGRQLAEKAFDIEHVVREHMRIYEELLA